MVILSGCISISNLPPHRGLIITLVFFKAEGMDSVPPYNGHPPTESITDNIELCNKVDLECEMNDSQREVAFEIEHPTGHFYLQLRVILFRKNNGKAFAQTEQFFFGRSPLPLFEDLHSFTLPIECPSTPLEELESYGTIEPKNC